MKTVFVDMPIEPAGLEKLETNPVLEVRCVDYIGEVTRPQPRELIEDANIMLCVFPPENFGDMKQLELIQICSAGYTQLMGLGLVEKQIRACNGRGVFDSPVAEWCVSMMINMARDLNGMIRDQEAGLFDSREQYQNEIRGRTLGIWGYGGIGRQTARLARALGLTVHVMVRNGVGPQENVYTVPGTGDAEGKLPDRVFTLDQKREFLSGLDFLVLAIPMNRQNEGIVGEEELRTLPDHAILLNPARGPLVNEQAMLKALRESWIAGAALDAHWHYPLPPDHPIRRFPNVIITPHISGSGLSPYFTTRVWDLFCRNVERYLAGEPLLNELSAAQLNGE